ncbi:hypothetical protein [Mycolicibacterium diernhoferi]|uniref:Uncharacterized protein n=1 Tax=Mycolicibacterium diernhoferi TaxID=1801 RepID=A0A1Q4HEC6_9MYCO|nr:hypothetical protein [Mycolicibacterium diernhoferi]OJZ65873.1 hypothetical protein BRW64_10675 [Mycolicibacterium diernhoferi]OPE53821.1 hypothetical protein BV510_13510 [Mycolicibacterium diernhoferi]PEG53248.1 hypothetical protein CRI78_16645 [Mycolicibacterium diernhoferi]QYL23778.1 hypothetical protein K0O62_05620 [Mycolicibacterium diernhoferi]
MATTPTAPPDVEKTSDADLDQALREAVLTIESTEYQNGNVAFSPLTTRDWVIIATAYVLLPALLALVVGTA